MNICQSDICQERVLRGLGCDPREHSPGGTHKDAPLPFRPGKTRRDHRSGAWSRRFANRRNDPGRSSS